MISRHIHYITLVTVSAWIITILTLRNPNLLDILYYLTILLASIWIIDSIYHTLRTRKILKKLESKIKRLGVKI